MPIYKKSSGEEIDTSTMAMTYIERALNKAELEGNQDNIDALNAEIAVREGEDPNATVDDITNNNGEINE